MRKIGRKREKELESEEDKVVEHARHTHSHTDTCLPDTVAAIHAWTLHIRRLIALHSLPHCSGIHGRGTTVQHLVAMSRHCRRANLLQLIDGIAIRQATASRVAVLQPHRIRAVLGLDLCIGLCIGKGTVVPCAAARTCGDSVGMEGDHY